MRDVEGGGGCGRASGGARAADLGRLLFELGGVKDCLAEAGDACSEEEEGHGDEDTRRLGQRMAEAAAEQHDDVDGDDDHEGRVQVERVPGGSSEGEWMAIRWQSDATRRQSGAIRGHQRLSDDE